MKFMCPECARRFKLPVFAGLTLVCVLLAIAAMADPAEERKYENPGQARLIGWKTIEVTVPAFVGEPRIYLGRVVSLALAAYTDTLEEKK